MFLYIEDMKAVNAAQNFKLKVIKRIGEVLYVEVEKGIPFQYSSIPNIMSILTQDLEGNEETSLVLNRNFPSSEYRSLTTPHRES